MTYRTLSELITYVHRIWKSMFWEIYWYILYKVNNTSMRWYHWLTLVILFILICSYLPVSFFWLSLFSTNINKFQLVLTTIVYLLYLAFPFYLYRKVIGKNKEIKKKFLESIDFGYSKNEIQGPFDYSLEYKIMGTRIIVKILTLLAIFTLSMLIMLIIYQILSLLI